MAARILDGTRLAGEIRAEVAAHVRALAASGVRPGLAVAVSYTHLTLPTTPYV